jgi:sulfate/thiosulfate-binding protein
MKKSFALLALFALAFATPERSHAANAITLLNVSYDPTRELYDDYNKLFATHWKEKSGQDVTVTQSNGGSGKQARAVIDGLKADVVTLALAYDIDAIADKAKLLPPDWQTRLPHDSSPYTSTVVLLVRKGNPKHIQDWDDLVKDGVQVITPNPKTSGGARWNYLAAWAYAQKKFNHDEAKVKDFMHRLYANVPVLDTGARGATTTFVQRGIGDVLIAWENEAYLARKEMGQDKFDIINPSMSIVAEPPVAVVDHNAQNKGTLEAAREYVSYLYTPEAQELIAKNFYRPTDEAVLAKNKDHFPAIPMATIKDFGGWKEAQKRHFDDGGVFDEISGGK